MPHARLNVLVLFDVPYAPPNHLAPATFMRGDEWKDERDVIRALERLGHRVSVFGVFDDVRPLVDRIQADRPDVVFNQCESFRGDRALEPDVASLLELLAVPYTGAGPEALRLCKDKGLSKRVLAHAGLRVPRFAVVERGRPARALRLPDTLTYPAIVKPLSLDASEGIAQSSIVPDPAAALARVKWLHRRYDADAIVEEYVEGRELYVGVYGNDRLTVLPPTELYFKRLPRGAPRCLTYKAKWDREYRRKYGIDSDSARPISPRAQARIEELCRGAYRLLAARGYARIDLRLAGADDVVFLEANPNPSIKKDDDFAWAARRAGIAYDDLLATLLDLALERPSRSAVDAA